MITRTLGLLLATLSLAGCAKLQRIELPAAPALPVVATVASRETPREPVELPSRQGPSDEREDQDEPPSILVEAAPQVRVTRSVETPAPDIRSAPAERAPAPVRAERSTPRGTRDALTGLSDEGGKRLRRNDGGGYDVL